MKQKPETAHLRSEIRIRSRTRVLVASLAWSFVAAAAAEAALTAEELAKLAQNPIANLISVPFQNNTNFNVGPYGRNQDILSDYL